MYWESEQHKFGCIIAIIVSILMIIGFLPTSILMIILSYVCSCFFYFCYRKLKDEVFANYVIINEYEQRYLPPQEKEVEEEEQADLIKITEPISAVTLNVKPQNQIQLQSFLYRFKQCKLQAKGHLNSTALLNFNQIEDLLKILSEKIKNTMQKDLVLQEKNIDKIVQQYLIPAVQNYIQLPIFLRERSFLENNITPTHLLEIQLGLIQNELEQIIQLIYQNDLNRLHDHAEFLRQKLEREEFFNLIKEEQENNDKNS